MTCAVDVYLFRVLSPLTLESSYFWPDETAESTLKYPYRFNSELVAKAMQVPTACDNPGQPRIDVSVTVHSDGLVDLRGHSFHITMWTHDPERLHEICRARTNRAQWRPALTCVKLQLTMVDEVPQSGGT